MDVTTLRDTPYQGLVPYSEKDEQFFFGREMEQEVITGNLMASRLTLLYGPSGVGKSSVLHAGVAAGVRNHSRENVATKGVPRFVLVIFRDWKDDPLKALLQQVRTAVTDAFQGEPFEPVAPNLSFAEELNEWADRIGGKLLIVLDQFEEYFLYPEKKNGTSFGVQFPQAVNKSDLRVNFLVSIREDWLAKLDHFKVDLPSLFDNYLRMEGLERKAARDAIEQPVARYNLVRKADEPVITLHNDFAGTVLDQLEKLANKNVLAESGSGQVKDERESERGKTRIQPPYLQLVMINLWKRAVASGEHELHPEMLNDPDTAETIIQSHLEEVMSSLTDDERAAASSVFNHLVTPSGIKIAQSLPDLAAFAHLSEKQIAPMLDKLSSKESGILSQLVPPPGQSAEPRYEIYHDVLAPAIVRWCNAYKSAKELHEAQERAEQERLIARQQARNAARLRLLSIALAVITVLAVSFAIFGVTQFRTAQAQKGENAKKQVQLDESKRIVGNLTKQYVNAQTTAEKAISDARDAKAAADEAKGSAERAFGLAAAEKRRADTTKREAESAKKLAAQYGRTAAQYGQINELSRKALSLYKGNYGKEAIQEYRQVLKVYNEIGDVNGQADTLVQMGAIAAGLPVEIGSSYEAPTFYEHALALYRQNRDVKGEADVLLALAPLYPFGEEQKALDSVVNAAELYQKLGDEVDLASAVTAIQVRTLYAHQLEPHKELESQARLLEIYRKDPKFLSNQIATLQRIGDIHFGLKDKAKAIESYRLALQLAPTDGNILKVLGDLYYQTNDKQAALESYKKADFGLKEGVFTIGVDYGVILISIADIYRQLDNKTEALAYYHRLEELPGLRCTGLMKAAEIYIELNQKQLALDRYRQIVDTPDQGANCTNDFAASEFAGPVLLSIPLKSSKDIEVEVLNNISSLYKDLGDPVKSAEYSKRAEARKKDPF